MSEYDAVVVGAGPNGLTAAIELARNDRSVLVVEAADTVGGGARTKELTLPGFRHDVCSTTYPLAVASPAFQRYRLDRFGLEWVDPPAPLAHPLDGGTAVMLERSVDETAEQFGPDAEAYRNLMGPLARDAGKMSAILLSPLRVPRYPLLMAKFGLLGLRSAVGLGASWFTERKAQTLLASIGVHSNLPLMQSPSAAFSLTLGLYGHALGWPHARGGAQQISQALAACLEHHGGEIRTGWKVENVDELPESRVVLFDLSTKSILDIAGHRLPEGYARRLKTYQYGPGVFKVDWALDGPVPWAADDIKRAGTVHVCGPLDEIREAERAVFEGGHPERPFVVAAQPSVFDDSRAPAGKHTFWAYTHVPAGSDVDMTDRIESQIERYAPGFRDRILDRRVHSPDDLERYNPNLVNGDITGGVQNLWQAFTRPVARLMPYSIPGGRYFICSAAAPPGGGVHGMCGYHAARAALAKLK